MGETNLGNMFAGFAKAATKFGSQAAKSAASSAAMIKETVTAQSRIHMDYEVAAEVGQCGPEGVWKVHRARPIKSGAVKTVSVWILNKSALQQSNTSKTAGTVLEADIRQTNLLKYPGVVRILEPLEETRTQYLLVTEEVIGSLDSWLKGRCRLQVENNDNQPLSELEMKHGLRKVAETLSFVHDSCKRVHCNVSPQSIILAADGTWKLAGFGLSQAASTEDLPGLASSSHDQKRFSFDYESTAILDRLSKPELPFCAPEVVSSVSEVPITGAADTFSLACVAYRVLRGQNLFTAQTTPEYRGTLASMNLLPVDGLPNDVQAQLRSMLSSNASQRPPLQSFISSSYFRDDRLLRALGFLDSILQRETAQKHAFIQDLPSFLPQFPPRVLRHRVLPVLMNQWQDDALKDAVLPLVLKMVKDLPTDVFQDQVLPELRGILETASGPQLLKVLAAVPDLQAAMRVEQVEEVLMPLLLKGLASSDTRIQEEVLKALKQPLNRVRAECIHKRVLPQLLKTCVDVKSASVRVHVLQTLTGVAPRLTEQESDVCARMIKHLTSHEASDSTLVHVLELCEAINGSKSAAYAARTLVPLLSPLLTASSMTAPTFRKYIVLLRAMLEKIEDRLHAQKASSHPGSANGGVATAKWDDDMPNVPTVNSAASSSSAQGLGFMDNDFLSAWSTPVTSPSSTAASSTAPPSTAGQPTSSGMRPPVAKAAPLGTSNLGSGLGLLDMPTGASSNGVHGLGGLGHQPMQPSMPPPHSGLVPSQPHSNGMSLSMGASKGIGLATSPQVHAPSPAADPFADLLGSQAPAKPSQQQSSTNWDPFA